MPPHSDLSVGCRDTLAGRPYPVTTRGICTSSCSSWTRLEQIGRPAQTSFPMNVRTATSRMFGRYVPINPIMQYVLRIKYVNVKMWLALWGTKLGKGDRKNWQRFSRVTSIKLAVGYKPRLLFTLTKVTKSISLFHVSLSCVIFWL